VPKSALVDLLLFSLNLLVAGWNFGILSGSEGWFVHKYHRSRADACVIAAHFSRFVGTLKLFLSLFRSNPAPALKCDLRDDAAVRERLKPYGAQTVQYEEGLAVARRIRASRYLECSSKHNRGVTEVFYEAARVSLGTRPKGSRDGCVVMWMDNGTLFYNWCFLNCDSQIWFEGIWICFFYGYILTITRQELGIAFQWWMTYTTSKFWLLKFCSTVWRLGTDFQSNFWHTLWKWIRW
jgi:hypothetical protein